MTDTPAPGLRPWSIAPEAQAALTLEAGRQAVLAGEYAVALAVAEEILDASPNDTDALLLVADVAPRCNLAACGVAAARQARARGADPGAAEAAALLAACRVEEALAAAEARLAARADDARAWAVRGLCLDLLGRPAEAEASLARAADLRPSHFPPRLRVEDGEWDGLLLEAQSRLPFEARDSLRRLKVELVDLPDVAELTRRSAPWPPPSPTVDGFLDPGDPPRLQLYRKNLARGAADREEVVERILGLLEDGVARLEEGA